MNQLSEQELLNLLGGQSMGKCDYLQDKAAEHMANPCDDEEEEDAWWVMWAIEYQQIANSIASFIHSHDSIALNYYNNAEIETLYRIKHGS